MKENEIRSLIDSAEDKIKELEEAYNNIKNMQRGEKQYRSELQECLSAIRKLEEMKRGLENLI